VKRIASAPKFRPSTLELKKNHVNRHIEHKTKKIPFELEKEI
jgi:hypothetical protein